MSLEDPFWDEVAREIVLQRKEKSMSPDVMETADREMSPENLATEIKLRRNTEKLKSVHDEICRLLEQRTHLAQEVMQLSKELSMFADHAQAQAKGFLDDPNA